LGLSTDASYRFERGTDPINTMRAAERAASLIAELGAGTIALGSIDIYPVKINNLEVTLRIKRIERILGYVIPDEIIVRILQKLGIAIISRNESELKVSVPPFSPDI
jgi:phenylalanyl-tRNA synthetase beta chain